MMACSGAAHVSNACGARTRTHLAHMAAGPSRARRLDDVPLGAVHAGVAGDAAVALGDGVEVHAHFGRLGLGVGVLLARAVLRLAHVAVVALEVLDDARAVLGERGVLQLLRGAAALNTSRSSGARARARMCAPRG
jgi:hypothetical protein